MRYFSTFSGIGGFEVGIHNAFTQLAQRNQGEQNSDDVTNELVSKPIPVFVGYSEIDKYAIKVYERNFPNVKNYGDITRIEADELPDFDCLVGGFPCQAFSIAGKRKGFDDTRGTLFFDLARILRAKRPRLFVFENVKGLLSHDNGNTFSTIIATITELGYDCQWQVLNSKNHGVPQNRERVYIVGHLRGTPRPEVFPIGSDNGETINPATNKGTIVDLTRREPTGYRERKDERAGTLDANYYKGIANQERPGVVSSVRTSGDRGSQKTYLKENEVQTLSANPMSDNIPRILVPEATKKGYAEATVGQAINLTAPNSKTRRGRVSDIANTLDTGQQQHTLTQEMKIRRLTPVECERLQGFPDNWTKYGEDDHGVRVDISDTQRYKMCGNAVTTNVIQAVFERIFSNG
jgi:DNA (cytosine-5)-methyltransferase 1